MLASCAPTKEKGTTLIVTASSTVAVAVDHMVCLVKDGKVLATIDTIFNGKISINDDMAQIPGS
jgi:hypothetical protein